MGIIIPKMSSSNLGMILDNICFYALGNKTLLTSIFLSAIPEHLKSEVSFFLRL